MLHAGDLVCVTGASGFIASELVASLLSRGLRVNGTVRSLSKSAHLKALPGAERLSLFEADLLGDGVAFDPAVAGCGVVFHTACPFVVTTRAAELGESFFVTPAVRGTEAVLAACARAGGAALRRVVLTSSCAAIFKKNVPADHVYDEATWNDPEELATRKMWYSIGKTMQERAAWAFMDEQKPAWDLVAINPCMVAGSARQPALNASLENVLDLLNGSKEKVPNFKCVVRHKRHPAHAPPYVTPPPPSSSPPPSMPWVHLRDVVDAHIAAAEKTDAAGRYLMIGSWVGLSASCGFLRSAYPAFSPLIPTELEGPEGAAPAALANYDSGKVEALLGRPLLGLDAMLRDSVESLLAHGHLTPPGAFPAAAARFCDPFAPTARLELRFAAPGGGRGRAVWEGGDTTPTLGAAFPSVRLAGAPPGALLTFILTDADAPSVADPKFAEWQHWVHVNAVAGAEVLESGESITAYFGPAPGKDTGRHRYALVAYAQPGPIAPTEERVGPTSGFPPRRSFNSRAFAAKYSLVPLAVVTFLCEWDSSQPALAARLSAP